MHVLMLGWEFPPFITGGLGTACFGLTKALDRRDTKVTFVLPKAVDRDYAEHVTLVAPQLAESSATTAPSPSYSWTISEPGKPQAWVTGAVVAGGGSGGPPPMQPRRTFEHVDFISIPAEFSHPYQGQAGSHSVGRWTTSSAGATGSSHVAPGQAYSTSEGHPESRAMFRIESGPAPAPTPMPTVDYGGDLLGQVYRYARFCVAATRHLKFDVIHAHDWLTYPAGLAVAQATGRPLVVHVHSTEFDRSGVHVNQVIYDIERRGLHSAMKVITVSQLTKNVVVNRYGVRPQKIEVVYNGVELEPNTLGITGIESRDKIVLYFGRITYQKGPEYFVHAARRVLEMMDNVKFVVAGSGDQARNMIELAAHLGIGHKVLFTGFLRGRDIDRVFALADLYVMPSVSEPFGIAPLEAMAHNVPALISKSSGVSEVLTHALKVDFWDIDDMANKIIAVLRHPPLSQTLREHGQFEVRKLTWDGAASRCEQVYRSVMDDMRHHAILHN
jgi:glycosyltransferase involved in cell wall biosynthesis